MTDYIKKPCQHCPYRNDIRPFLTDERMVELAYLVVNPYNVFTCHKTMEHGDDDSGERVYTEQSKTCAGFLTLMAAELGEERVPQGFDPSYDICYSEAAEMSLASENNLIG